MVLSLARGIEYQFDLSSASAIAFHLFLALIPLFALAGWMLSAGIVGQDEALQNLSTLLKLTPRHVNLILREHLGQFNGGVAPIAIAGSIWIASGAFHTLMTVFETTFETARRSWLLKRSLSILCVLALLIFSVLSTWVTLRMLGGMGAVIGLLASDELQLSALKWAGAGISLVTALFLTAALFWIAVPATGASRRIWPGACVAVFLGGSASAAFALYAGRIAQFAAYYGSLAAVAVVMLWLWLWSIALLFGGEVNALLEGLERPKRDPRMTPRPTMTPRQTLTSKPSAPPPTL